MSIQAISINYERILNIFLAVNQFYGKLAKLVDLILSIVEEIFLRLVMDGLPYWAKMPPRHWKKRFTRLPSNRLKALSREI